MEELGSARRERILDAAREVVVREGFAGASVQAIALEAGVTRPTLYGEFGDRGVIFAELLDREEATVMGLVAAGMPEMPLGVDPLEFAGELADVYLEMVSCAPRSWQFVLMPSEGAPPGTFERVQRGKAAIRKRSAVLIAQAARARGREVDAELLSHAALAVGETAARLVLEAGEAGERAEVARTLRWLARRVIAGTNGETGIQNTPPPAPMF
ncbi:TetR/AcrR family transcriptional regulator [Nocardia terrae]|uniref:TetR/AcrR family transcriptional regulator n=1 Tax=Nocardia terrae TaxID=2675851 RepID=UPI0012FA20AD|nr:TetR/AcrR family transcriptional regulator [Nocardia terrae]